jgi:hypothetical protein
MVVNNQKISAKDRIEALEIARVAMEPHVFRDEFPGQPKIQRAYGGVVSVLRRLKKIRDQDEKKTKTNSSVFTPPDLSQEETEQD